MSGGEQLVELLPCPFCGRELTRGSRRINPSARCTTEDCYGSKMPVVNLDVPTSVAAWNTRPALYTIERSRVRQIILAATPGEREPYKLREQLLAEIDKLPILGGSA